MKNKFITLMVVAMIMILLCGMSLEGKDPVILRWALIPAEEAALELENFLPQREYLEQKLGMQIEMTVCDDYTAVVQAIKFGHTDMARFGPFNYVLATTQTRVEAIVRGIKKSTGKDAYYSLIITRRYSDISTIDDLEGRTFAFVDQASCSGGLVPMTELRKAGVTLGQTYEAGSHGAVILAVEKNKVDAGACADNRLLDAIEKGAIRESDVVVIHRSKPICNSPIAVRSDMNSDLKDKIRQAFLDMPRELALTSGTKCLGYVEAKDEDYNAIREIAEILDLDLTKK